MIAEQQQADHVADERLRQFVGYNVKRAMLIIASDMLETLEPLELRTVTFSSLAIITATPDISQSGLAQALGIERSGVVSVVDELEQRGLIKRHKVKTDRRSYALRATEAGEALWKAAEARVRAHEDRLFSAFSDAERKTLSDLLRRVGASRSA